MTEMPHIFFADGSVRGQSRGFYWRAVIGAGHYGSQNGPFATEGDAAWNAAQSEITRLRVEVERCRAVVEVARRLKNEPCCHYYGIPLTKLRAALATLDAQTQEEKHDG